MCLFVVYLPVPLVAHIMWCWIIEEIIINWEEFRHVYLRRFPAPIDIRPNTAPYGSVNNPDVVDIVVTNDFARIVKMTVRFLLSSDHLPLVMGIIQTPQSPRFSQED